MVKKTKAEKKAEVIAHNQKRVDEFKEDISIQENKISENQKFVDVASKIIELSNERLQIKLDNSDVLENGLCKYNTIQRYHDINIELDKLQWEDKTRPQLEQNIAISTFHIDSSNKAIEQLKEELALAEVTLEESKGGSE